MILFSLLYLNRLERIIGVDLVISSVIFNRGISKTVKIALLSATDGWRRRSVTFETKQKKRH
jgi:hypothetical protein